MSARRAAARWAVPLLLLVMLAPFLWLLQISRSSRAR
jgi:hypothetical protein